MYFQPLETVRGSILQNHAKRVRVLVTARIEKITEEVQKDPKDVTPTINTSESPRRI